MSLKGIASPTSLIVAVKRDPRGDDMSDFIFTNLQQDFSDCYAYYKISEEGVKRSKSNTKDNAVPKLVEAVERSLLGATEEKKLFHQWFRGI